MARAKDKHAVILDGTRKAAKRTPAPDRAKLMTMTWPNASSADEWLRRRRLDLAEMGLLLAPSEDDSASWTIIDRPSARANAAEATPAAASGVAAKPAPRSKLTPPAPAAPPADAPPAPAAPAPRKPKGGKAAGPAPLAAPAAQAAARAPEPASEPMHYGRLLVSGTLDQVRVWVAFHAKRLAVLAEVTDEAGQVIQSFDERGAKPGETKGMARPAMPTKDLPRATGTRRRVGFYDQMREDAAKLARQKEGVLRTKLNELNGGEAINWKGLLEQAARKTGETVSTDKSGPSPRYFLVMQS